MHGLGSAETIFSARMIQIAKNITPGFSRHQEIVSRKLGIDENLREPSMHGQGWLSYGLLAGYQRFNGFNKIESIFAQKRVGSRFR